MACALTLVSSITIACASSRGRDDDNGALVARDAANHVLVVGNAAVESNDSAQARGVALANLHAELGSLCDRLGPKLRERRDAMKVKLELVSWQRDGLEAQRYDPVVIGVRERGGRTQARAVVDLEALFTRFDLLDDADKKTFLDEARLMAQTNERDASLSRYDTTPGAVQFSASTSGSTTPPPPPPGEVDDFAADDSSTDDLAPLPPPPPQVNP